MDKKRSKLVTSIISLIVILVLLSVGLVYAIAGLSNGLMWLFAIIPFVFAGVMIYIWRNRLKEIDEENEDDYRKY